MKNYKEEICMQKSLVRRIFLVTCITTVFVWSGSGWADERKQLAKKFHSQLTSGFEEYKATRKNKALAACIDWGATTFDRVSFEFTYSYYTAEGSDRPIFVSELMNSAIHACKKMKKKNKLNCDCVPVDKNGKSVLRVPKDVAARLAR